MTIAPRSACSPNFGYDLCVSRYRADQMQGVDLSCWKVALNGAEPVHAETIDRFIETFAGHGFDAGGRLPGLWHGGSNLADIRRPARCGSCDAQRQPRRSASRMSVTAPIDAADVQLLVGCGRALVNEQIAIVDPDQRTRLPPEQVGEIWVNGPNVARAYWKQSRGHRDRAECTHRRRRRRRELAAHRRPRLPRRGRRIIRHRPDQGPHHRQGHQSLSAGYRANRAGRASGVSRQLRRGILRSRRARRGNAGHRAGDRAHRTQPDRSGRDEGI